MGQAHRHSGNFPQALEAYQAFLREKKDPNPKIRAQAEQYIAFSQLAIQADQRKASGTALAQKSDQKAAPAGAAQLPLPGTAQPPLVEPPPPLPTVADASGLPFRCRPSGKKTPPRRS